MQKLVTSLFTFLLIATLATGASAEAKKAAGKTTAPSASANAAMKTVVGAHLNVGGMDGILKINIDKQMDLLLGGSIVTSSLAGSTTQLRLTLVGMNHYTGATGGVRPHFSGLLQYISGAATVAGTSLLNVGVGWGVSAPLGPNTSLIADIYLLQYGSVTAGAAAFSTWSVLTPSIALVHAF